MMIDLHFFPLTNFSLIQTLKVSRAKVFDMLSYYHTLMEVFCVIHRRV